MGKIKTRYGLAYSREHHFSAANLRLRKRNMGRKRQKTKIAANETQKSRAHVLSSLEAAGGGTVCSSLRGRSCPRWAERVSRGWEERLQWNLLFHHLKGMAWNSKFLPIPAGRIEKWTFYLRKRWFLEASEENWVTERHPQERSKAASGPEPGPWVLHKFIRSFIRENADWVSTLCSVLGKPDLNKIYIKSVTSWNIESDSLADKCIIVESDLQKSADLEELWNYLSILCPDTTNGRMVC